MTEEIIIDGVNVAGCEFYFEDNGVIAPDGTPERANICTSPERSCENNDSCYCNKDYYLKTLDYEAKISYLIQALEEIRARIKQYHLKVGGEVVGSETIFYIEKKINEVLNDRD